MFVLVETIGPLKNVAGNKKTRDLTVRDDSSRFSIKVALWNALAESYSATNRIILMSRKVLGHQETIYFSSEHCVDKSTRIRS
jgi:hypothetical protein